MQLAAEHLKQHTDFTSFSKRNTQVKNFICRIEESYWVQEGEEWVYRVRSNRFLRGMVRALTSTMLLVGRGKIKVDQFNEIILKQNCQVWHGIYCLHCQDIELLVGTLGQTIQRKNLLQHYTQVSVVLISVRSV